MLLAGDVGGTKIVLGLFEPGSARPRELHAETYRTADHDSLPGVLDDFIRRFVSSTGRIDSAAVGVAGPVVNGRARLTNVPWHVDTVEIAAATGTTRVALINDLEAMAWSVPVLDDTELEVLQQGVPPEHGNAALIAAGTGLGEALLLSHHGAVIAAPSEAGHADFAARNDRESLLMAALTGWYGRARLEDVLSGPGLVNLHRFIHGDVACPATRGVPEKSDWPSRICRAGIASECTLCVETLDMFVQAYGAEAGNLALRTVATRGVFVGGGIAPKMLPALKAGGFMSAFRTKAPMQALMERVPVKVILNPRAALVGSAVHAAGLTG